MRLVDEFGLSQADAELVVSSVGNGGMNLLLGAGASYGAVGGDGAILRGGSDLAHELNHDFKVGLIEPDKSDLALVYADVKGVESNKATLNSFLAKRFSRCTPTWQKNLHEFPWKRIWTLNIDDLVERSLPRDAKFSLRSFLWFDSLEPRPLKGDSIQVVYLHGRASKLNDYPDHLIFSLKEYASSERALGWHTEFRSEWVKKPFIVCGARLQDEYDLATVMEFGNRSRERGGCPSVIVLRDFQPGQEARYSRQGLIPVKATGEDFFSALFDDLNEWRLENISSSYEFQKAKEEIISKFKRLSFSETFLRKGLDFYATSESQWRHIVEELDAPFGVAIAGREWISDEAKSGAKVLLIHGNQVSGKTATVLRIGAELVKKNFEVWLFRGEERFDEDAIVEYSKEVKNSIFIFDDCADISSSLLRLGQACLDAASKVRVIATCETKRLRPVEADIADFERIILSVEPLGRKDFLGVFDKRGGKGRLGRCTKMVSNEAWKEFDRKFSGKLLEWLESLENAYSYRQAIVDIFEGLAGDKLPLRGLLFATATVHRFGYSLPFFMADQFVGARDLESLFQEGGALSQIGYLDERGVRLRSNAFSQFLWGEVSKEEKYVIMLDVAKKLAPLVVPQTIARRSVAYLILRNLMDHEMVLRDLGGERSDEWYAELNGLCSWNARFWEQRALLAHDLNRIDKSYSYAKKAISLHSRDAFPHTTLGKICLKIGVNRQDAVGVNRFWEGVEALAESRKLGVESGQEWEHPYVTFFTYALQAIAAPHFSGEAARLSQAWDQWMRAAKESRRLNYDETGRLQLERWQRQWLLASAKSG